MPKSVIFESRHESIAENRLDETDIKIIVRDMDNKLLSNIRQKHDQSSVNATQLTGICLVIGGVLITVGTYTGWIKMGNYFVFAYGQYWEV